MKLFLPKRLDDAEAFEFIDSLVGLEFEEELSFDFSRMDFARPFASLVVANAIRRLRDARNLLTLQTAYERKGVIAGTRSAGASYLAQMGFFDFLSIDAGKKVGQAPGGVTYNPITRLSRATLVEGSTGFYSALEHRAASLAAILFSKGSRAFHIANYCLVEAIRNAFEHTDARECFVFAQAWANEAELVILDWGRGVRAALRDAYPGISADDAVRDAIKPGVTSGSVQEGPYTNTGFGLYVMSELCRRTNGSFVLWSSDVRLLLDKDASSTEPARARGTALKLQVRPPKTDDLIAKIAADGDARNSNAKKQGRSKVKYIVGANDLPEFPPE